MVEKTGMKLDVELGPIEDTERDDVEPEEECDACAQRSVDPGVVGKAGDIPAEDDGGEKPRGGRDEGTWKGTLPGLLHGRTHVIDDSCDADTARESNDPAKHNRKEVDRGSSRG